MESGDGLVVRLRPERGRIDAVQAAGIADLAQRYGNGLIDLTSRANLQIRGVTEATYPDLIERLAALGLLDGDPETEARRNILLTPFWAGGDETISIADQLGHALISGPDGLPVKFGFAVDCGRERVLSKNSADVRIERDQNRELMVRADGAPSGRNVRRDEAVNVALQLAEWFVASGGVKQGRGRMAAHIAAGARLPDALNGCGRPAASAFVPKPALTAHGALFGAAFGQLTHTALRSLAENARALRMTPWRMLLAEGLNEMPRVEELITEADDPRLRVVACSGAPRCREAHADTRALAAALAPRLDADLTLHISGCAKGCAHPKSAPLTLVATGERFDLVRDGTARDVPIQHGLTAQDLIENASLLGRA
jgi:precorrin-3B synthase